jgi:hypothetical protein
MKLSTGYFRYVPRLAVGSCLGSGLCLPLNNADVIPLCTKVIRLHMSRGFFWLRPSWVREISAKHALFMSLIINYIKADPFC